MSSLIRSSRFPHGCPRAAEELTGFHRRGPTRLAEAVEEFTRSWHKRATHRCQPACLGRRIVASFTDKQISGLTAADRACSVASAFGTHAFAMRFRARTLKSSSLLFPHHKSEAKRSSGRDTPGPGIPAFRGWHGVCKPCFVECRKTIGEGRVMDHRLLEYSPEAEALATRAASSEHARISRENDPAPDIWYYVSQLGSKAWAAPPRRRQANRGRRKPGPRGSCTRHTGTLPHPKGPSARPPKLVGSFALERLGLPGCYSRPRSMTRRERPGINVIYKDRRRSISASHAIFRRLQQHLRCLQHMGIDPARMQSSLPYAGSHSRRAGSNRGKLTNLKLEEEILGEAWT